MTAYYGNLHSSGCSTMQFVDTLETRGDCTTSIGDSSMRRKNVRGRTAEVSAPCRAIGTNEGGRSRASAFWIGEWCVSFQVCSRHRKRRSPPSWCHGELSECVPVRPVPMSQLGGSN